VRLDDVYPIATLVQMIEPLPEPVQERVVEHLRAYLLDLEDELEWDRLFNKTQPQLIAATQQARQQIAEGKAKPLNLDDL
jgi:hypothetical protein